MSSSISDCDPVYRMFSSVICSQLFRTCFVFCHHVVIALLVWLVLARL